jgi:hypothetical protein
MVIAEKSTQTLAAANGRARTRGADAFDEFVAESLMVAFAVVVLRKNSRRDTFDAAIVMQATEPSTDDNAMRGREAVPG